MKNENFTAAAIATDEEELERFQHPSDDRLKKWFYVKTEKLQEFIDRTWGLH